MLPPRFRSFGAAKRNQSRRHRLSQALPYQTKALILLEALPIDG